MARHNGKLIVRYTDGTEERVPGNRHAVPEAGVLSVWTDGSYGGVSGQRYFSLANVKSFYWEGE